MNYRLIFTAAPPPTAHPPPGKARRQTTSTYKWLSVSLVKSATLNNERGLSSISATPRTGPDVRHGDSGYVSARCVLWGEGAFYLITQITPCDIERPSLAARSRGRWRWRWGVPGNPHRFKAQTNSAGPKSKDNRPSSLRIVEVIRIYQESLRPTVS